MHVICADPGGLSIYTGGLKTLNGWDRGFESR